MAELRIERQAAVVGQDLPDIYAFIARHDPAAAERVLDAVEETLRQLTQHPDCGALYPTRNRRLQGLRMFPVIGFHNYLVFYRVEDHPHPLRHARRKTYTPLVSARIAQMKPKRYDD